jgi:hypothetical protein
MLHRAEESGEFREAKNLSQDDIERSTGLARPYIFLRIAKMADETDRNALIAFATQLVSRSRIK